MPAKPPKPKPNAHRPRRGRAFPHRQARAFVAKSTFGLPPTTFLTTACATLVRRVIPADTSRSIPASPRTPRRSSPIMLIARVILFALLAVLCGSVVFLSFGPSSGWWDLGFLCFSVAFLASFVHLLWQKAEGEVGRQRMAEEDADPAKAGENDGA